MQVLAFLCLVFGFTAQLLLDGQVFSHVVFGIICGIASLLCGIGLVRRHKLGKAGQWEGWLFALPGLIMAVACLLMAPSAYEQEKRFNEMSEIARQRRRTPQNASTQSRQPTESEIPTNRPTE
jgi:FtsH-binding integral membrane protein